MALTKCRECGNEISTKADACPKCGAKVKRTSSFTKFVLVLIVIGVIGAIIGNLSKQTTPPTSRTETEKLQQEQAAREAANKADLANRAAKFATDRSNIIAKAKALLAQKKWNELVEMDNEYAFARDAELNSITETARSKLADIAMAKDRAARKKEGVRIGMTKEEVLMSSWGKPSSVNKTTTTYGTHEQWVYDRYKNGYLYFENDILTAIQN